MDVLGLVDSENVPIAVIHYAAPAAVLLYFVSASSVPTDDNDGSSSTGNSNPAVANGDVAPVSPSNATAARRRESEQSALLKWIFVLAVLTFVCFMERDVMG